MDTGVQLAFQDAQKLVARPEDVDHLNRRRNRDPPHLLQADILRA
jgi:hypothetical protein